MLHISPFRKRKWLGLKILQALGSVAKKAGCYKSILRCSEENEPFYIKWAFERRGRNRGQFYGGAKPL